MEKILNILIQEFKVKEEHAKNTIKLIDEGNTIPFIARYRKEVTGAMDDVTLRNFNDKLTYLRNLESKKEDVIRLIGEQDKLTKELEEKILKANTLQEVEDLYAPYKKKKSTRATKAKEKGLEALALDILNKEIDIFKEALKYIDEEKEVSTKEDAINGASDIIAEMISDDAKIKKYIREDGYKYGNISSKKNSDEESVYEMYYEFLEGINKIKPHKILAINRGEKEGFLKVKIEFDDDKYIEFIKKNYILNFMNEKVIEFMNESIKDSYKRLIYPSVERQIRTNLTEIAHERAILIFSKNLKQLLMQPPVFDKRVLGFDPAYRTGCKLAIVDEYGKFLYQNTIYPTAPQNKVVESKEIIKSIIDEYNIDIIAIGNGTASRESEEFIANTLKEIKKDVKYVIINEAGASVYSASKIANEEYPDINVSIRGAISIAKRLQDPLSELVKIDPKSIGVGQYQHDVNQKRLEEVLTGVIEDSVNSVGVDLNTASAVLMSNIAGINSGIAKNIVSHREENGVFNSRKELLKVKRLGKKAFEQCAGFMRINNPKDFLDSTAVHPESYKSVNRLIDLLDYKKEDIINKNIQDIDKKIADYGLNNIINELEIGEYTLKDIINELKKPARDPREDNSMVVFRSDVLKIEDIKVDMILPGTVRNIVDFGAFVDIGIKNDALLHKSQMSNTFVKDPMDIVSVGDIINVKVIDIDLKRGRISISLKGVK